MIFNLLLHIIIFIGVIISARMLRRAMKDTDTRFLKGFAAIKAHPFTFIYQIFTIIISCLALLQFIGVISFEMVIGNKVQTLTLLLSVVISFNLLLVNNCQEDSRKAK